ncbi:hypothetical protein HY493_02445 [Candidatus Woesearchaeota archaeon]|nr:hypothetical protein [Candidatus Woesearchaeota archaeon]
MRDDERGIVTVGFKRGGIVYRFTIAQPPLSDFATTSSGRWRRTPEQQKDEQEAEVKRRFRSLANYVKALMDAVDTGIIKAEEALLPYRLLPSGETVFERAAWQLQAGQEMDLVKALPSGRPKA